MRHANNAVSGIKDVKLTGCDSLLSRQFSELFSTRAKSNVTLNFYPMVQSSVTILLGQLMFLVFAFGLFTLEIPSGEIAGYMALMVLVVSRVLPAANRFLGLYFSMHSVWPWVQEVVQTSNELKKLIPAENIGDPGMFLDWKVVNFNEVSFQYSAGKVPALKSINFSLKRNNDIAVIGKNGAGKSTFIDVIAGLYHPTTGNVTVDGVELEPNNISAWQAGIGYVPQNPYLMDATIATNISLSASNGEYDEKIIWNCLKMVKLDAHVSSLEHGIHSELGENGVCLSGGQRQRLAIARALYKNPQLLILDEATSNLDHIAADEVVSAINALRGQITLVTITHDLSKIKNFNQIIVFEDGELVRNGAYSELLEKGDLVSLSSQKEN